MTHNEWRANPQRCAEFEVLLAHPLMQQALGMLKELALPTINESMMNIGQIADADDRHDAARYRIRGGIAYSVSFLTTLATPLPAAPQPLPPEWEQPLPDPDET